MKNYKFVIQYEGTRYQGWQRQITTDQTIQGKLESILTRMTGKKVEISASGRTDAGVHALGQVANAHMETDRSCSEILNYVNQYLPEDIAIIQVEEVDERFHARLWASEKTYLYRVVCSEIPHVFDRRYVLMHPEYLDVERMKSAARLLTGTHDFMGFSTAKKTKKSTVRTVYEIGIEQSGDEIRLCYRGDGFLYHMVRILTGTLLEVGRGERSPESVLEIFESRNRERAGELVPAKGLTLVEVRYEK
ncbi:MAG: tRNA pseudouridine(38-40) synthase TruA [Lachnospiraceae bacterium]|nr:tRNA pseudouridine(38-40) synthase TruA [Lachnospiraceae bacterium]